MTSEAEDDLAEPSRVALPEGATLKELPARRATSVGAVLTRALLALLLPAASIAVTAPPIAGQGVARANVPPVDSIIKALRSEDRAIQGLASGAVRTFAESGPSRADMDRLADSLVAMATDPSSDGWLRGAAIIGATNWARGVGGGSGRAIHLLETLYDSPSIGGGDKAFILLRVPDVGVGPEGISFLRRVAVARDVPELLAALAVEGLAAMGEPGRATLRELHETHAVTSPRARLELKTLAAKGLQPDTTRSLEAPTQRTPAACPGESVPHPGASDRLGLGSVLLAGDHRGVLLRQPRVEGA